MSTQVCRNCANYSLHCMTCYNDHEYHDLNDSCKEYEPKNNEIEGEIEAKNDYKPKFTPGPWHTKRYVGASWEEYYEVSTFDGLRIAISPTEADSHLIAAAPEMYEALDFFCTMCQSRDHETNCANCRYGKALRKARGESEVSE